MRVTWWIQTTLLFLMISSAVVAQESPFAPLLKRTVGGPVGEGAWERTLSDKKFDTSTSAMVFVALNHPDYWTRVAALHVLGTRTSDPAALSTLLSVLDGPDGRLATWSGEILTRAHLEQARVTCAMRRLVAQAEGVVRSQLAVLTRSTIVTQQQESEMQRARDTVLNGLLATRVLTMLHDAYGYALIVEAMHVANQTVYIPFEVLLLVTRNYIDADLPYGPDLVDPVRSLANNRERVAQIRQLAQQLLDRLTRPSPT